MKLNIKYIEFRNFLCFGNKWQKIELLEGVNLITGANNNTGKSNGSGKSSFLDAIIFALYGNNTKDLTKPSMINWKNKKNCEVKITFLKDNDEYIIHRGLKPNFLKVYKNDLEMDQLAKSLDIQSEIESDIIEMDFDTFISIIHYNSTTSKSIFNVSKSQKRSFIEKLFGLEAYSSISQKCNEKINKLNTNILDIDKDMQFNNKTIEDLSIQNKTFNDDIKQNKDLYIIKIKNINKEIFKLNENINKNSLIVDEIQNKKTIVQEKLVEYTTNLEIIEKEIYSTSEILKSKNIDNIDFNINDFFEISKKIESFNIIDKEKELKNILLEKELLEKELDEINKLITNKKIEESNLKGKLSSIKDFDIKDNKCPLCHSKIEPKKIQEDIKKKKNIIENDIAKISNEILKLNITEKKSEISEINIKISNIENQLKQFIKLKENFIILENKKVIYDIYLKEKENIDLLKNKMSVLTNEKRDILVNIEKYNKIIKSIEVEIEKSFKLQTELSNLQNELNILLNKQQENEKQINKIQEYIENNNNKINNYILENDNKLKEKNKNKDILDYFEYIKKICKDENVKQYAISNLVPYLTNQANGYLTEAGFDFYLKLDSWLNVDIKGPGISEAGYGNLSSGQQKTTNLAMILSFLDICKFQYNIFPDILLLDEVLDGSIDSITLSQMFNIISKKQREDKLKLFIVSHRKEINEVDVDNIYKVEMTNGFSEIKKIL